MHSVWFIIGWVLLVVEVLVMTRWMERFRGPVETSKVRITPPREAVDAEVCKLEEGWGIRFRGCDGKLIERDGAVVLELVGADVMDAVAEMHRVNAAIGPVFK